MSNLIRARLIAAGVIKADPMPKALKAVRGNDVTAAKVKKACAILNAAARKGVA